MRRRLYASPLPAAKHTLTLDDESRRHAQVLRLSVGDELRLFDAQGAEADARVTRNDKRALVCEVEAAQLLPAPELRVHLALCLPKAGKLELILRMATELGVSSLTLVHSERSVPKWGGDDLKLERLKRISVEACAQSEQAYAPVLSGPLPLSAALAAAPTDALRCVFLERSRVLLPSALPPAATDVWAIVGPEGGFAPDEVALLTAERVLSVSLGPGILRVETACIVACALLFDRLRTRSSACSVT